MEKSRISLGFGNPTSVKSGERNSLFGDSPTNKREGEKARLQEYRSLLDNALCLCLYCVPHQKILLRRTVKREIYLPFKFFSQDRSWLQVTKSTFEQVITKLGAKKFAPNLSQPEMLDILGIDFPFNNRYHNRITMLSYYNPSQPRGSGGKLNQSDDLKSRMVSAADNLRSQMSLTKEEKPKDKQDKPDLCLCEHLYSSFVWMHIKHIDARLNSKFWGPEPAIFLRTLIEVGTFGERFEAAKTSMDLPISSCWSNSCENPKIKNMLDEAKYRQKIVVRLYNEFMCHCYPSRYMTLLSFKNFMQKCTNWNFISHEQYEKIFRALDFTNTNYLSFDEILQGFAAMDTITPHSGTTLEIRAEYIYRMYKKSKYLTVDDFKCLGNDICSSITDKAHLEAVHLSLQHFIAKYLTKINYISSEDFVAAIIDSKDMKMLTTTIFRSPTSLLITITTRFDFHIRTPNVRKEKFYTKLTESLSTHYSDSCVRCKTFDFQIHSEVLRVSGAQGDVLDKFNLDKDPQNSKVQFITDTPEPAIHEMMKNIKLANDKPNENWHFQSRQQLLSSMKIILERGREAITQDSKIKSVCAPAFIVPGTQGVFNDVLKLEKLLWRPSTSCVIISGNFIDQECFTSLYCFVYLICSKILRPDRFILLRGRNENAASMGKLFTSNFKDYQDPEMIKLLEAICDELPLAAVVEEQIYVSSGGIPKSFKSLESLRKTMTIAGKVNSEVFNDFLNDIWEEVLKDPAKSSIDQNQQFNRNISSNLFTQFRHQNGIKLCFLTHSQHKLAATIKTEFDCRIVSLSAPEFDVSRGRTISCALITYDRIRLFEIANHSDSEANRRGSSPNKK